MFENKSDKIVIRPTPGLSLLTKLVGSTHKIRPAKEGEKKKTNQQKLKIKFKKKGFFIFLFFFRQKAYRLALTSELT